MIEHVGADQGRRHLARDDLRARRCRPAWARPRPGRPCRRRGWRRRRSRRRAEGGLGRLRDIAPAHQKRFDLGDLHEAPPAYLLRPPIHWQALPVVYYSSFAGGIEADALQANLGRLPSRYDLVAARSLHLGSSQEFKERMPFVSEGPNGKEWVARNGASFGLVAGVGSAGRKYEPGKQHRADRMAETGLYEAGLNGIRRPGDSGPARQGARQGRRRRRSDLRRARRRGEAGGRQRLGGNAAHLQRLHHRLLQALSAADDRPGLPAVRRHPRRREGSASRRQARRQRRRAQLLLEHDADVASDVGSAVGGDRRDAVAAPFPHLPHRSIRSSAPRPPALPASPCATAASACSR